jgi:uncharacterized protein (DUF2236 family)
MIVTRHDLDASLERIRSRVNDPAGGIHGPGSMAWRVNRETFIFLGGGAAALMQLAHPYVAHAVDQHSATRTDMLGRFRRTFIHVLAMSFGDVDEALRAARRVHAIHTRITGPITEDVGAFHRGHRYHANDAEALLWVYATLVHTAARVTDLVVAPLCGHERERYYQESKRFAYLFGIPDALLPADWHALTSYMGRVRASGVIRVGAKARELGTFLMQPPRPALAPVWRWYAIMTAGLLPAELRQGFGLPMGTRQRALFAASVRALRGARRLLPPSVRYIPAYIRAQARVSGKAPSRTSVLLERLVLQGMKGREQSAGKGIR